MRWVYSIMAVAESRAEVVSCASEDNADVIADEMNGEPALTREYRKSHEALVRVLRDGAQSRPQPT